MHDGDLGATETCGGDNGSIAHTGRIDDANDGLSIAEIGVLARLGGIDTGFVDVSHSLRHAAEYFTARRIERLAIGWNVEGGGNKPYRLFSSWQCGFLDLLVLSSSSTSANQVDKPALFFPVNLDSMSNQPLTKVRCTTARSSNCLCSSLRYLN